MDAVSVCQYCGEGVSWSRCPEDAGYAAFTHAASNTVACVTPKDQRRVTFQGEVI